MAHDLAEQALNKEVSEGNIIKKLWKGTLFKKYYEQKYTNEFLENKRQNPDGKTINELIKEQSKSTMERFVLGAVEEDNRYIHEKSGESLKRADEKTETAIKRAIEDYVSKSIKPGEKLTDLTRNLYNEIDRAMAEAIDRGDMTAGSKHTNYLEIAKQAAERYKEVAANAKTKAEHDLAMSQVMAGFKVYNAEVRDGARTEAHRDNIDKIVNALESNKFLRFVPSEIIAGAAGVALGLTQTGARAVFGAAGGIIASSVFSGLRERNRLTEDRARMLRDVASGLEYGNSANKKISKHEARIGGTLYDMQPASVLTSKIEDALSLAEKGEKGYGRVLMQAIAEARVRIDFSDSEQKDLISYSSAKNTGKERLELDKILIKAERALNERGQKDYQIMQDEIREEIINSIEKQDKEFKNYRALAAVKKAGKTLGFGVGTFFISQEVIAAFDTTKIGIFEKSGLLEKVGIKTINDTDAKETVLASVFGGRGTYEVPGQPQLKTIDNVSDPNQIEQYKAAGYTSTETTAAYSTPDTQIVEVDPSASTARINVKYDGWASGGTKTGGIRSAISEGRFISKANGTAVVNGQTINYDPNTVKGYLTVGDAKFEIAGFADGSGQLTWSENGVFTTTTGETIKAIGDNGEKLYKYFEVAIDRGDVDGVKHIIPIATDVGTDNFSDKISQVIETSIEHPAVYSFSKVIPGAKETVIREISTNNFAFSPEVILARTGLGEARPISIENDLRELEEINRQLAETGENSIEADLRELAEINRQLELTEAEAEGAEEANMGASETAPEPIRKYDQAIRDRANILGDTIASALLTHDRLPDMSDRIIWETAISNLTPVQREAIREINAAHDRIPDTNQLDFGHGFRSFLAANHPDLL